MCKGGRLPLGWGFSTHRQDPVGQPHGAGYEGAEKVLGTACGCAHSDSRPLPLICLQLVEAT